MEGSARDSERAAPDGGAEDGADGGAGADQPDGETAAVAARAGGAATEGALDETGSAFGVPGVPGSEHAPLRLARSWQRRMAVGLGLAAAVAGVAVLSVFIYSIFDGRGRDGSRDRSDRYYYDRGSWEGFEGKDAAAWGDGDSDRGAAGPAKSKKCDADGGCLGARGAAGRLQDGAGDRRGGRFSRRSGSGYLSKGGPGSGPWFSGDSPGAGWDVESPVPWGQGSPGACFSCDCAPWPSVAGPFAGRFGRWGDRSAPRLPGGPFGIPGVPGAADPFAWGWGGDSGWFGYAPFDEGGPARPSPWPGPEEGDGFWSYEGDGPGVLGDYSGGLGLGLGGWDVLVMWIMELLSDPEVLSELLDSLDELLGEDGPLQGLLGSDGLLDGLLGSEGLEGFEGDGEGLFGPGGPFGPGGLLDGLLGSEGLEGFEGDAEGLFGPGGPFGELMDGAADEEVPTPTRSSA